jgi:ketosteroid isomerase-like protein
MLAENDSDLVRRYFSAYHSRDRSVVEDLLREDFTFTSPYDDHIGKAAYFERCWPNNQAIRAHHIQALIAEGDAAFVLYECELMSGTRFRNTEYFRFGDGRIKEIEVYFGSLPETAPVGTQA